MTERDAFEARFGAAVHAYVGRLSSDLDPFEFAHRIAGGVPRRQRRAIALGWRGVGMPRVVWALLLLAALLAAMVGGALIAGSQPVRKLPAVVPPVIPAFVCPPGSTPDEPGPVDQARPPDGGPMALDRATGKIVMLASPGTWEFDVCTNTWAVIQAGQVPYPASALAYDPVAQLVISVDDPDDPVVRPPHAWAYSRTDDMWTRKGPAPAHVERLWYDAASSRVAAWTASLEDDPGTIWTYDVASDTWAVVGALEVLGGFGWNNPGNDLVAYDASLDRLVATVTGGERTRLFDMHAGDVVDAGGLAPWAGACGWFVQMYCYDDVAGAAIAYDDRAGRTVVRVGSYLFAYDGATDRWDTLFGPGAPDSSDTVASADAAASALARESWSMVSDPVNGRLVVLGRGAVVAFDATTRQWTVLLEPSVVMYTPTP